MPCTQGNYVVYSLAHHALLSCSKDHSPGESFLRAPTTWHHAHRSVIRFAIRVTVDSINGCSDEATNACRDLLFLQGRLLPQFGTKHWAVTRRVLRNLVQYGVGHRTTRPLDTGASVAAKIYKNALSSTSQWASQLRSLGEIGIAPRRGSIMQVGPVTACASDSKHSDMKECGRYKRATKNKQT